MRVAGLTAGAFHPRSLSGQLDLASEADYSGAAGSPLSVPRTGSGSGMRVAGLAPPAPYQQSPSANGTQWQRQQSPSANGPQWQWQRHPQPPQQQQVGPSGYTEPGESSQRSSVSRCLTAL